MAKRKTIYICQQCSYQSPKWMGKCSECGAWSSFVEEETRPQGNSGASKPGKARPQPLSKISVEDSQQRIATGIAEWDRVLGGGIFPASVVLLAGEPGIGKSTLMLQMQMQLQQLGHKALYVSGEESLQQIKNRAARMAQGSDDLMVLAETDVAAIEYHLEAELPRVAVIDSVQAIYNSELSGAPGNVSQVRECSARLFKLAKEKGITLFLIGHVTKEGTVAGPKILEHLVDVVIQFEANTQQHRIVRSIKNRFGASNELGVFEMFHNGLREVGNISTLFMNPHQRPDVGSSIVCSYEGSRPLLVEVQSLVSRTNYGTPQRTVTGFNQRRLSLILAILEKYCRLNFGMFDVFVKVAGGLHIEDPGIDLGVAASLYSSILDQPADKDAVYIGELGLGGEVRPVSYSDPRIQESQKMGFQQVYLPAPNVPDAEMRKKLSVMLSPVQTVSELLIPAG